MTLRIMAFRITTLIIIMINVTISIKDNDHLLFIIMLSVIMPNYRKISYFRRK
jgi:hypothetical protein